MTAISGLPDGSTPTGTEEMPGVQSATTKRFQIDDLAARADTRSTLGCELTHSVAQSIPNAAWTTLSFDTETRDDGAYHAPGDNTKITIPAGKTGKYTIAANASFASNATGYRVIRLLKNGTAIAQCGIAAPNGTTGSLALTWTGRAAAADYFQVQVNQNSGGNLNVTVTEPLFFNATLVRLTA